MEIDEDREVILKGKHEVYVFDMISNPMLADNSMNHLSKLQNLSVIDIYNYFKKFQ